MWFRNSQSSKIKDLPALLSEIKQGKNKGKVSGKEKQSIF